MKRHRALLFILTIFILSLAHSGIQAKPASFSTPTVHSENETVSFPHTAPNSELEGSHIYIGSGGHITLQKNNAAPVHLSTACDLYKKVSSENLQTRRSSLFIKDYLFHIYPSHNFW
jgi:hypothetical protein